MPFRGWNKGVVIHKVSDGQYTTKNGADLYLYNPSLFPHIFEPVIDDVQWLAKWLDEQDSTSYAADMIISNGFNISKFRKENSK